MIHRAESWDGLSVSDGDTILVRGDLPAIPNALLNVHDLTIGVWGDGEATIRADGDYAVQAFGAFSGLRLEGLHITGAKRHGIYVLNRRRLVIHGCRVSWCGGKGNLGNGIEIGNGCDDAQVQECAVHDCYDVGISGQLYQDGGTLTDLRVLDNVVERCGMAGIEVAITGGTGAVIERAYVAGNVVRHSGRGLDGNRGGTGILISGRDGCTLRARLEGNAMEQCASDAVRIRRADVDFS